MLVSGTAIAFRFRRDGERNKEREKLLSPLPLREESECLGCLCIIILKPGRPTGRAALLLLGELG